MNQYQLKNTRKMKKCTKGKQKIGQIWSTTLNNNYKSSRTPPNWVSYGGGKKKSNYWQFFILGRKIETPSNKKWYSIHHQLLLWAWNKDNLSPDQPLSRDCASALSTPEICQRYHVTVQRISPQSHMTVQVVNNEPTYFIPVHCTYRYAVYSSQTQSEGLPHIPL